MFRNLSQLDRSACLVMFGVVTMVAMVCTNEDMHAGHVDFGLVEKAACPVVKPCDIGGGVTATCGAFAMDGRPIRVRVVDESAGQEIDADKAREHLRGVIGDCDAVLYIPQSKDKSQPFYVPETLAINETRPGVVDMNAGIRAGLAGHVPR